MQIFLMQLREGGSTEDRNSMRQYIYLTLGKHNHLQFREVMGSLVCFNENLYICVY